jgi:hypothetical protein
VCMQDSLPPLLPLFYINLIVEFLRFGHLSWHAFVRVLLLLSVSFARRDALQLLSDGGTTPIFVVVVERECVCVFMCVSGSVSFSNKLTQKRMSTVHTHKRYVSHTVLLAFLPPLNTKGSRPSMNAHRHTHVIYI